MDLGYLTHFREEELKLASDIGYTSLEVHITSWSEETFSSRAKMEKAVAEAKALLTKYDLRLTAVARYMPNPLTEPLAETKKKFRQYLTFTALLGVPVLTSMAGRVPEETIDENIPRFKKLFTDVAKMAEDCGVKIGFENWPSLGGYPIKGAYNIAYTPAVWEKMFDAVPSPALGLEFDPSHLYWLGIDHIGALKRFAERVYHIHAKDTEILYDQRNRYGIFESPGWWRYRIPGWGEVDWTEFISALNDIGYNGGIAVEHEDPLFAGPRRVEGLILGYKHLSERLVLRGR